MDGYTPMLNSQQFAKKESTHIVIKKRGLNTKDLSHAVRENYGS